MKKETDTKIFGVDVIKAKQCFFCDEPPCTALVADNGRELPMCYRCCVMCIDWMESTKKVMLNIKAGKPINEGV